MSFHIVCVAVSLVSDTLISIVLLFVICYDIILITVLVKYFLVNCYRPSDLDIVPIVFHELQS